MNETGKIRIKLRAFDYKLLDQSTKEIVDTAKRTGAKIAGMLRTLKSYFYDFVNDHYPIVKVKYLDVLPEETKFRMNDVSIEYGPEILDNYPVYTKVSTKLTLATSLHTEDFFAGGEEVSEDKIQELGIERVRISWY